MESLIVLPSAAKVPTPPVAIDPISAAIRNTHTPMIVTDPLRPDNPIIFVNDAFLEMTGYSRDEVTGNNCRFLQGQETDKSTAATIRNAIDRGETLSVDILNYRKDGTPFWNALFLSPLIDEGGLPRYFFASQFDITERKARELKLIEAQRRLEARNTELEASLFRSNLLLHEVDHRAKNNLQMICAMLTLQLLRSSDPGQNALIAALLERIEAISLVHKRLYNTDNVTEFDLAELTAEIAETLVAATGRQDIKLELRANAVSIRANIAASAALVVKEVITNALKYGFPAGRGGLLRIVVEAALGICEISVQDQGPGMPSEAPSQSFGKMLVETLVADLKGTIEWTSTHPGTTVKLKLPLA